jgi:Rho-binding antiterminator
VEPPYTPVACGFYDVLEAAALRGTPVEVVHVDGGGAEVRLATPLADVFSRGGAEFVRLADGREVRLDRLVRVDGHAPARAC